MSLSLAPTLENAAVIIAGTDAYACLALGNALINAASDENREKNLIVAIKCHQRAAELSPNNPNAWTNMGIAFGELDDHAAAAAAFSKALELGENNKHYLHMLSLYSHYCGASRPYADMLAVSDAWGRGAAAAAPALTPRPRPGLASRPLRLGIYSGELSSAVSAPSLYHWLRHKGDTEVVVYSPGTPAQLPAQSASLPVQDAAAAARIVQDQLDALIYLELPSLYQRDALLAAHPAPLQGLAHHVFSSYSKGLFDFQIMDSVIAQKFERENFKEAIIDAPYYLNIYPTDIADQRPPPVPPPSAHNGFTTYGCFSRPSKINQRMAALFAALLQHDPAGRLLLGCSLYDAPGQKRRVMGLLQDAGAALDRIDIFGRQNEAGYWRRQNTVDVAIDTPTFSGGLTSIDALLQGVPVVTCMGDRPAGRLTASMLAVLGLEGLIAEGVEEMIGLAVALGQDFGLRQFLRGDLRRRFVASPLCDAAGFHRKIEADLRALLLRRFPDCA